MELIGFLISAAIAITFAVAAIAKLVNLASSRDSIEDFGVPAEISRLIVWVLPIAELTVAAMLFTPSWRTIGALAAFCLLCTFTAAILYNLIIGKRPDCNCFGQVHKSPIGSLTVLRNLVLAAGALVITIPPWGIGANAAIIAAFTTLLILALLARALSRQREITQRLAELDALLDGGVSGSSPEKTRNSATTRSSLRPGTPAPNFHLKNLANDEVSLKDALDPKRTSLFFFLSSHCGSCVTLMPKISRWHKTHETLLSVVVIGKFGKGNQESFRRKLTKLGADWILIDIDQEVAKEYRSTVSPGAVMVRPDGSIGSEVAYGDIEITSLVEHAAAADSFEPWLSTNEPDTGGMSGSPNTRPIIQDETA